MYDATTEELRTRINTYPPYVGAGIEVTQISEDWNELRVRMPLTDDNRNLVGTHFGGSLYAMADPHLMILLVRRLGPDYVVWDRSASIEFRKPGRGTVHTHVRITDEEVQAIEEATADGEKHLPTWTLTVEDDAGEVVALVHKTLYVRRNQRPPP